MTFREKLAQEQPEYVDDKYIGGCGGCPYTYGYEHEHECDYRSGTSATTCRDCWDREMPLTPEEQEQHDLEINEEIIQGYCNQHGHGPYKPCPADSVCDQVYADGTSWHCFPDQIASPTKQRAMLDAFEAALPPEDDAPAEATPQEIPMTPEEDMTYSVRRRIPESVRDLIDSRIISIDNQIKFLQAERQDLVDFWNGKDMEK